MKLKNLLLLFFSTIALALSATASADIGRVSFYGNNATRVNDFIQGCNISVDQVVAVDFNVVTVSDGVWDNGASCGRKYLMRCISTPGKHACTGNTILVTVVGRCPNGNCMVGGQNVTMKIAFNRYGLLVQSRSAAWANIEFQQR